MKRFLGASLVSVCIVVIGAITMHLVFSRRWKVDWSYPSVSALHVWWADLAVWSVLIYVVSALLLLAIFWKVTDFKSKLATVNMLCGNWLLFFIAEVIADVDRIPSFQTKTLSVVSWACYVFEPILWFTTCFVLFSNVDAFAQSQIDQGYVNAFAASIGVTAASFVAPSNNQQPKSPASKQCQANAATTLDKVASEKVSWCAWTWCRSS